MNQKDNSYYVCRILSFLSKSHRNSSRVNREQITKIQKMEKKIFIHELF